MTPSQILDKHGELLDHLTNRNGDYYPHEGTIIDAGLLYRFVETSYCFRVTEDMIDLMVHAGNGLVGGIGQYGEPDDLWDMSLAPTGCGLVRFDKPVTFITDMNTPVECGWLLWGPHNGGHRIWLLNDNIHLIAGWIQCPHNEPPPPSAHIIQALWLLIDQTITVIHDEHIDRPAKRRAIRKGLPPKVSTITLRRTQGTHDKTDALVEWQHRWIVRGHWRKQACGHNRQERKRIWINPFMKGPDDKPLIQSEKLYNLRR